MSYISRQRRESARLQRERIVALIRLQERAERKLKRITKPKAKHKPRSRKCTARSGAN